MANTGFLEQNRLQQLEVLYVGAYGVAHVFTIPVKFPITRRGRLSGLSIEDSGALSQRITASAVLVGRHSEMSEDKSRFKWLTWMLKWTRALFVTRSSGEMLQLQVQQEPLCLSSLPLSF